MMTFHKAFQQYAYGGQSLPFPQVGSALAVTQLVTTPALLDFIVKKYTQGGSGQVVFGQFLSICSYILLCGRIMQKFDRSNSGKLNIDYYGLQSLGLWFV